MDQLVNAVETASGPVYTEERYAAVQLEGTTRDERVQSLWRVLRANGRGQRWATGQSEMEENAHRWLETAGDDAAARASAFAEGGYLDPSDFTAAPDSPPTPQPIPRPPPGVTADVRDDVQDMNDYPGGLEAAMAQLFAGLPPTLQESSSDSDSSEGSEDSDAGDSSGDGPLPGAVTEPRVEADL